MPGEVYLVLDMSHIRMLFNSVLVLSDLPGDVHQDIKGLI